MICKQSCSDQKFWLNFDSGGSFSSTAENQESLESSAIFREKSCMYSHTENKLISIEAFKYGTMQTEYISQGMNQPLQGYLVATIK